MAQAPSSQRSAHPLPAYNFRVTVDGVAMRFSKVSGLQREHKVLTYRHGLSFLEGERVAKHTIDAYISITLEQGVVIGSTALHSWLERKRPCAMEVSLCDEQGVPVVAWSIAKALPVKLGAPTFDAATNAVGIESLEVKVAGVSMKHLG